MKVSTNHRGASVLLLGAALLAGCSFYARGADDYRTAVRTVLDTRQPQVKECYAQTLKADETAKGKVVVRFDVEPKTGVIRNPAVVDDKTTANPALQQCVLGSLEGLKLDPADQRKGEASFAWDFTR